MGNVKQNAIPYTKERCLKAAIFELVDDHAALKREVVELREHNRYLESRVGEASDYATLLVRHNALVGAVAWERECEELHGSRAAGFIETWANYIAARAEVGRLIANETEPTE